MPRIEQPQATAASIPIRRRSTMKIFIFHPAYAHLTWLCRQVSRRHRVQPFFDPKKGHELYNRYLDELELVAELGYDGISVNEHHQNAYGLMPSPVVMAAAL
jgi:hypothetical protein